MRDWTDSDLDPRMLLTVGRYAVDRPGLLVGPVICCVRMRSDRKTQRCVNVDNLLNNFVLVCIIKYLNVK